MRNLQGELSVAILKRLRELAGELRDEINIMDFCGTHEWTITHYGIRSLLPDNINLIAGPGCPVCVTPAYYVDQLIKLSFEGVKVYTYGDSFKLPASKGFKPRSLFHAKEEGGNVEVVYSFRDAISRAREYGKDSVFFAVGFETTMPTTSLPLYHGVVPRNLRILSAYRLTPPVVRYLFEEVKGARIDGVIAPGHVSAVIGASSWEFIPEDYSVPTVVAGFEAVDVLIAIERLLTMIKEGEPGLVNEYSRVVAWEGNKVAKKVINEVLEPGNAYWRGIGFIENSGMFLRDKYAGYDAVREFGLEDPPSDLSGERLPGCRCHEVVLGLAKPTDCPLFLKACTPKTPYGPCMVSIEGACRVWAENPLVLDLREVMKDLEVR